MCPKLHMTNQSVSKPGNFDVFLQTCFSALNAVETLCEHQLMIIILSSYNDILFALCLFKQFLDSAFSESLKELLVNFTYPAI